jgi:hypothetical protein
MLRGKFHFSRAAGLSGNSSPCKNKSIKATFRCIINKINSQAEKNVFGNGEDELHVRTSGPIRTSVLMLASITQYESEYLMNYFEREMNNCELSLLLHRPNIFLSEK